jgi:hypothetical protein
MWMLLSFFRGLKRDSRALADGALLVSELPIVTAKLVVGDAMFPDRLDIGTGYIPVTTLLEL